MNLDFKIICRICLKPSRGSIDLFPKNGVRDLSKEETEEIIEKIEKCYNVRVSPDDGLPTKVCHKCIQIVSFFYISMQNAAHSQQFLKNSLLLKQLAEKENEENHSDNSNQLVEDRNTDDISPPNLEMHHELPINVNNEGSREDLVNLDEKPPDDVIQDGPAVKDDSIEDQTLKPSSKPILNENNNELDVQLNKSSDKVLQEEKENNVNHLKPSKISNTAVEVETQNPKKDESIYDFDDDDEDDDKPLQQIISETEKSKESNKSYLKLKRNDSNVAINKNCTKNQVSHKLGSNKKIKNSNGTDKSTPPVLKSEKKLSKVKKSNHNKKKKLLRLPEKEKEDKLKEYYEKLLTTDNSLKVEYCRLTSQKSKLNKENAAEKKLTNDLNLKIYNLVRVTVKVANALSGMKTNNEKEKMERVFDRLISGDGTFENFAKQKEDMNNIREDEEAKNEDSSKKKVNGEKSEKSAAQKFADSLHENMKSKWNNLQLKVPDKEKHSDSSTVLKNYLARKKAESDGKKRRILRGGKVEPPKKAQKTQVSTPKEIQKTQVEPTREAQKYQVETSKETPKPRAETPKDTQKLQAETSKEAPKPQIETPKETQSPLAETVNESQETLKQAKKRTPKEIKIIGTDLDLDNILPYDAKRRRTTVLDNSEGSNKTPSKSEKKPTALDNSKISSTTPSKTETKDSKDSPTSSSETSPESKTPILKMKKLHGLKVGNKTGTSDKKFKKFKQKLNKTK